MFSTLDRKDMDLKGTLASLLNLQTQSDETNPNNQTFFESNRIARGNYGENLTVKNCNVTLKNITYLRAMGFLDCNVSCGYDFTEDTETFTIGYRIRQNKVAKAKELLSR